MIRIGKHPEDMPVEEVKAVFAHANEAYPAKSAANAQNEKYI